MTARDYSLNTAGAAPPPPFASDDARWLAVMARDRDADAAFRYAVRSTGVYCRPGCAARRPRRENVLFFATSVEARTAGFRPCRRCRPEDDRSNEGNVRRMTIACRLIEESEEPPSLDVLADAVGLSPGHVHRLFKASLGVTPRAYAAFVRARRVRDGLGHAPSVTVAAYDAGFATSSRFYAQSEAILGMRPRAWRAGGVGAEIRFAIGQCSLGAILVASTVSGICAIALGDDAETLVRELEDRFPAARLIGGDVAFEDTVAVVVGLVEAPGSDPGMPLDIRGTAFQQRVWEALRGIPPGEKRSYGEIAAALGAPKASRAVARACAANPLAVAVPCHRVVRRDGAESGYRWGIARKRTLLAREART